MVKMVDRAPQDLGDALVIPSITKNIFQQNFGRDGSKKINSAIKCGWSDKKKKISVPKQGRSNGLKTNKI